MSCSSKEISIILQKPVREGKKVYHLLELILMLFRSNLLKLNFKGFSHSLHSGLKSTLKAHKNKYCFDIALNIALILSCNTLAG